MEKRDIVRELLENQYHFARTMPKNPHWYTLRSEWSNEKYFEEVVLYIRNNSYLERFQGKFYKMFNLNGFKYWTMGAPLNETILINKARFKYNADYDSIADQYKNMFQDEESKQEEKELFKLLDIKGRVLDVGCGTGLLLEYYQPEKYIGFDSSQKMLDIMRLRFPLYENKIINCSAEDFYDYEKYDTIVMLFGVASYIDILIREKFKEMLNPGGKIYYMFYREDYTPITYIKTGINPKNYSDGKDGINFRNFKIVTYENIQ